MEDRHMVPNYYGSAATDGAKLGVRGVRDASDVTSSDATASDVSRCPFARGLGLLAGSFSAKRFLAKKLSKPFHHSTSLNSF
jgi:hypothetical protein